MNGYCLLQLYKGHQQICLQCWTGRFMGTWDYNIKSLGCHKAQSDSFSFINDFQHPQRSPLLAFTSGRAEVVYISVKPSRRVTQMKYFSPSAGQTPFPAPFSCLLCLKATQRCLDIPDILFWKGQEALATTGEEKNLSEWQSGLGSPALALWHCVHTYPLGTAPAAVGEG